MINNKFEYDINIISGIMRLLEDIISKEILDSHANIVGKVKDIVIDSATYRIESLIVTAGNNKMFDKATEEIIPIEEVGHIGDKILLRDMEKIEKILNM